MLRFSYIYDCFVNHFIISLLLSVMNRGVSVSRIETTNFLIPEPVVPSVGLNGRLSSPRPSLGCHRTLPRACVVSALRFVGVVDPDYLLVLSSTKYCSHTTLLTKNFNPMSSNNVLGPYSLMFKSNSINTFLCSLLFSISFFTVFTYYSTYRSSSSTFLSPTLLEVPVPVLLRLRVLPLW